MRRIRFGILAIAALAVAGYYLFGHRLHVDLTRDELQAGVDKAFPYETCKLVVACVTLSEPRVELSAGAPTPASAAVAPDRLRLDLKLNVSALGSKSNGTIGVSGKVRYQADEAKLYLDDLSVERFELDALSPDTAEWIRTRAPIVLRLALNGKAIYAFDEQSVEHQLARLTVRDIGVVDGKLRIRFRAPAQ